MLQLSGSPPFIEYQSMPMNLDRVNLNQLTDIMCMLINFCNVIKITATGRES